MPIRTKHGLGNSRRAGRRRNRSISTAASSSSAAASLALGGLVGGVMLLTRRQRLLRRSANVAPASTIRRAASIRRRATALRRERGRSRRRKSPTPLQQLLRIRHQQEHRESRRGACRRGRGRCAIDGLVEKRIHHRHRRSPDARSSWRSASIAIAASRRGRWSCRGPASRWKRWSSWRGRSDRRTISAWRRFNDPDDGQRAEAVWYPWPYVEGLTMAEATNELAFLVTGAYGKPVAKVDGRAAPRPSAVEVRLQVDQVDRPLLLRRGAAGAFLAASSTPASTASGPTSTRRCRIRAGARRPSATSPPRADPDADLQRLRRVCRRALRRLGERAAYIT